MAMNAEQIVLWQLQCKKVLGLYPNYMRLKALVPFFPELKDEWNAVKTEYEREGEICVKMTEVK